MAWSARARVLLVVMAVALVVAASSIPASAEDMAGAPGPDPALYTPPFSLVFPLEGSHGFSDSFGAIRDGGGRLHQGNDIAAPKTTPVLAAADGVISRIDTGTMAGLYVEITHADGWRTRYLHLNNDEPPPSPPAEGAAGDGVVDASSTDVPVVEDVRWGIPAGLGIGSRVSAGDVIGFVGDSGNAKNTTPHLHFEVRMPDGTPVNPYPLLTGRASPTTLYVLPEVTDEPVTASVDVVGHADAGDGFNSAVWAYEGIAYLGTYGRDEVCPSTGVRRYDVSDPAEPAEMTPFSNDYPGTSIEAIWVGAVDTAGFSGDLAVVAHRVCDPADDEAFRGLVLYDVTDPTHPTALGTYQTGRGTVGIESFDVLADSGRVIVVAAVPNSYLGNPDGLGDVRIIDVTMPFVPIALADWDFRRDAPATMREAVLSAADPADLRAQGITIDPERERVFVANWDAGVVVLGLSDPSQPVFLGRDASMGYQEGKTNATAFDDQNQLLVVDHRDVDPIEGETGAPAWGINVVFDAGGHRNPTLISTYSVDDALSDDGGRLELSGLYTPNDAVIDDGYLYAAWLSGGLHIVNLSDPEHPTEVASFVPPTRVDPQRQFAAPNGNIAMPLAWSVHVQDDLIYLSDLNTGLWILRLSQPPIGTD